MRIPPQPVLVFVAYVAVCFIIIGLLYAIIVTPEDKFKESSKAYNDHISILGTPNNNTSGTINITTGAPIKWWNESWEFRTDTNGNESQLFEGGCWNRTNGEIQIYLSGINNTATQLKKVCISTEPILINISENQYPYLVLIKINGAESWSK